jgi:hypothetical protein
MSASTTPQNTVHPSESRKYFIVDPSSWKRATQIGGRIILVQLDAASNSSDRHGLLRRRDRVMPERAKLSKLWQRDALATRHAREC